MGEAGEPRADRALRFVIGRIAVPRADDHPVMHERTDVVLVAEFRRQRQHHAPAMRRGERREDGVIEAADTMRLVDAALHLVDERAFDMDADDARNPLLDRGIDRGERGGDLRRRVADQRWQEGGGAIARMRRADRRDRFDIDLIVEQHPAAAIDLGVDEAGEEPAAVQIDLPVCGRVGCGGDGSNGAVGDDDVRRADGAARQCDPAVMETKDHKVSVTLLRCGGESGLWPRASASALAMR